MNNSRPVFLNLTQMRFPLTAIISILHRLSGVFLFCMLPWLLLLLHRSLGSAVQFQHLVPLSGGVKALLFLVLLATSFHLLAGIRHILMDMGVGESFVAGSRSAVLVLVLFIVLALGMGVLLW